MENDEALHMAKETETNRGAREYTAMDLRLVEGIDHVRNRPAMYIGDTGSLGLHHLLYEVLDNSIDEVLAGHANEIWATLHKDNSTSVSDNGRGIPTGINKQVGMSGVELVMTRLNAVSKFGGDAYASAGGLHGVGLSCVNFLSEWCEATVEQGGKVCRLRCERGVPVGELERVGETDRHGTTIRWLADKEIFGEYEYRPDVFVSRIRHSCYLNREVTIHFHNERDGLEPVTFHCPRGIADMVADLNRERDPIGDVLYVCDTKTDANNNPAQIEIALQYCDSDAERVLSFANNVHTKDGGTHVSGFKRG
jgi:DNA gyrase subunit B